MKPFPPARILVVGDVMIDRYLHGKVERISPEAPVPVVLLGREENRLGGAANVALNLKALGCVPLLAGVVGTDENAGVFRQLLREAGLTDAYLIEDETRRTTVKTRLVSGGQQLMRVDREDRHPLDTGPTGTLATYVRAALADGQIDLILLQDYNKGMLAPDLISQFVALDGVPVVVDPKAANFWAFHGVDLFKPNLREIRAQVGFAVEPELASLDRAAAEIFRILGCKTVMITLSEHGIYVHDGQDSAIYPTDARKIADVSGAGDTVISVVAAGRVAGMPLPEIARLANRAGAQVIAKPGVVPVDVAAL